MAKLALYQKYRSSTFDEVVGQEYTVRSIKNAIRENKIGHAYLFCGPRGTGKTTMARLLAKAVNCTNPEKAPCGQCENCIAAANGTHPDIIEINAANETHVEDIRELIERSRLAPMMGKHKIYIIDEVHQLSSAASSALLKTLEEPPENVIFILATTDPQKLLPTIISRCQRFDFTKIRKEQIRDHLLDIAKEENISLEKEAAEMIAILSDGGMRDSLSILDQCASFTNDHITVDDINRIYGLSTIREKIDLLKDIFTNNYEGILQRTSDYEEKGIDLTRFIDSMIDIMKDCAVYEATKKKELLKAVQPEDAEDILQIKNAAELMNIAEELLLTKDRFRYASSSISVFEVTCLKLAAKREAPQIQETNTNVVLNKTNQKIIDHIEASHISEEKKPNQSSLDQKEIPAVQHARMNTPAEIDQEEIVSLLVQCDKASRASDETKFKGLNEIYDAETKKYTSLLANTKIAASGKDCILLTVKAQAFANRINDQDMNHELYRFLKTQFGIDKMIYAVTEHAYQDAVHLFVSKRKEGTLPDPKKIERYSEEETKEKKPEDKVKEFFGEDIVEVV